MLQYIYNATQLQCDTIQIQSQRNSVAIHTKYKEKRYEYL